MAHLVRKDFLGIAGLDMAMWDVVGKVRPAATPHLGQRVAHRVQFLRRHSTADPAQMAEEAVDWVKRGFRTLYFKVGFEPRDDIARLAAVRSAVGDQPRIRVDANQAWSPGAAKRNHLAHGRVRS